MTRPPRIVPALLLLLLLLLAPGAAAAQTAPVPDTTARALPAAAASPSREVQAVRIAGAAPTVDGRLDEAVWAGAPPLAGLTQKLPDEGSPASDATEVRVLYDEGALYIGARMRSADPAAIRAPVSRRDNGGQAERLLVSLDPYLNRRTAYTLGVTAAGTRLDWYHATDSETDTDDSWDPVWTARVQRDSAGWTAEMRIPFSQLRFNRGSVQAWGINVVRSVPSRNEDDYWVLVPARETGWASRFGSLAGIRDLRPTRRVELTPYATAGAGFTSSPGEGNPFDDGSTTTTRVGGDLKMGLGPNLTLEATVNPDFGQVELDPAEVNLSAFETFFSERRPFFTEGSQLLSVDNYFYSRRIGAAPRAGVVADLVDRQVGEPLFLDAPRSTDILGAAKLTGRLRGGMSVGALAAVTDQAWVRTFVEEDEEGDADSFGRVRVAPRTAYGVARVQQEVGGAGSTVGAILTGVERDLGDGDPLAGHLGRRAVTGGVDWNLRFREGRYTLSGDAGFSHVAGDSLAILRLQRASSRYFQRPDAGHVELEPGRESLSGYRAALGLARNSGAHWLWNVDLSASSPGFEINDAGAMGSTDRLGAYGTLTYRETHPGDHLRRYSLRLGAENSWNFDGTRTWGAVTGRADATWKNFWRTIATGWVDLPSQSDNATRGGPLLGRDYAWMMIGVVLSPTTSPRRGWVQVERGGSEQGQDHLAVETGVSVRPGPRWQLSVEPTWRQWTEPRQFVAVREGGPAATFGQRYVFAFTDRSELSARLRLDYLFTPDLSLELYGEPYAASGRYGRWGELPAARSRGLRVYGTDGSTLTQAEEEGPYTVTDGAQSFTLPYRDFNVRSFRSNAVMRWEWRPGSTLFLVWQQDRYAEQSIGRRVRPGDLGRTLQADGDNYLALKVTYWLPVR